MNVACTRFECNLNCIYNLTFYRFLRFILKKNRRYLIAVLSILIYSVILSIFIVMLIDPAERIMGVDKLIHFGVFSIISYFLYFSFSYQEKIWFVKKHRTVLTLVIASAIGIGIEFLQILTPTMSTNIYDMIANLSGAMFTLLIIKYLPNRIKKLKRISI
jgi:glycopeptide antibiotics resistance protein